MPHPFLATSARPRILAHRGFLSPALAAEGAVENSARTFESALAAGADYIESDCHLTSDGEVVCVHDSDLRRVADDPRRVREVTVAELRRIMAPRGGLVTLGEALERFPNARFNLDVKAAAAAEPMGRLVAPHADRVLLTSFSDRNRLRALRAAEALGARPATSPGRAVLIRLVAAVALRSREGQAAVLGHLDALQIPEQYRGVRVLTPRLLEAAHCYGVEVHVWTVNDPERMRALARFGVDGLVTDRTDLALAAFPR